MKKKYSIFMFLSIASLTLSGCDIIPFKSPNYTVTWKNYDGSILETDNNVTKGETPTFDGDTPTKPSTAQYSYEWSGWTPVVEGITSDTSYTATFEEIINKYTITWKNYDGSILEVDQEVEYGATPSYDGETPTKSGNAQYSYAFSGWSPTVSSVTGDATYTATFQESINKYTVTWKNYDGSTLEIDSDIEYGSTPSFDGEEPTKPANAQYTYSFKGWSPEVSNVTGDVTYTATYNQTINKYTVTWKNYDNTTLEVDSNVEYGVTPSYDGDTPTKPSTAQYSYVFSGWSPTVSNVTGDATYIATFEESINKYTVTWKNYDDTNLEVDQEVEYGTTPTYDGETPSKPTDDNFRYIFAGWDKEVAAITGDTVYKATFNSKQQYKITFDLDGGTSSSYSGPFKVEEFSKDMFFFDCNRSDKAFRGWSYNDEKLFDEKGNQLLEDPVMAESMTFKAVYSNIVNLNIVKNIEEAGYTYGSYTHEVNKNVSLEAYAYKGYNFAGWYLEDTLLSENNQITYQLRNVDVTIEARFTRNLIKLNVNTYDSNQGLVLISSDTNVEYLAEYKEERPCGEPVTIQAKSLGDADFLGWYNKYDKLVDTNSTYTFKMPSDEYTLEAKWNYFTISYNLSGGTNNPSNPTSFTKESSKITLLDPTRNGYTFAGWKLDGKNVTQIDTSILKSVELDAFWNLNTYSITYELNGGTNNASNPTSYTTESENITLQNPTRSGYDFSGWYDSNTYSNEVTTISTGDYGNKKLYAKWTPTEYSITYELDGGTNNSSNPAIYTIESHFSFKDPTKVGYEFQGWYDENDQKIMSISTGTIGDLTLKAHWNDGNTFTVALDPGDEELSKTSMDVQYDHEYSLPDLTKTGYTFEGWFDESTKVDSAGIWKFTSDKTLVGHWSPTNYSITYELDGGTNNPSNPSEYTIEDCVALAFPSKDENGFTGWYLNDKPIREILKGNTGDITLEARWSSEKNSLSVTSEDNTKGNVEIIHGSGYTDEIIVAKASPIDDYVFKGWYNGSVLMSSDASYTFAMPENDLSLVARFCTKTEGDENAKKFATKPILSDDGKTIQYGLYPQTHVNDETLITALNELTTPDLNGWYLYEGNYYAKSTVAAINYGKSFSTGTLTEAGKTYWFKCEPIVWNVLSNNDGSYYVMSKTILDTHIYFGSKDDRIIDGKTIHASNYEYSDIKPWLLNDFYNSAFFLGDNNLVTTNSAGNPIDPIRLPTRGDMLSSAYGFPTVDYGEVDLSARYCFVSDWARARGVYYVSTDSDWKNCGAYWLSTVFYAWNDEVYHVTDSGEIFASFTYENGRGVRLVANIVIE